MPIYRPNTVASKGNISGSGLPNDPIYISDPFYATNIKISNTLEQGFQVTATGVNSHAQGLNTKAIGPQSHAEGNQTTASNFISHAEGQITNAFGEWAHSEGAQTLAYGTGSHAEGITTTASGNYAHSEGQDTWAIANGSHAEGLQNSSSGLWSHVEGHGNIAYGLGAHAEGRLTIASASYSHAEGYGTVASGSYQNVIGQYNKQGNNTSLFVIGNGTDDSNRGDLLLANSNNIIISGSSGSSAPNSALSIAGNKNDYVEINIKNNNAGNAASTDIVVTANNGTDTSNYIDLGINSSVYNGSVVGAANDAYLYNTGSHLWIGNATANKNVYFFAGATASAGTTTPTMMISASADGTAGRVGIGTSTPTAKLTVNGDIHISGANNITFANSSQGIIFAGNTGGTISANTLNDYEEGTWTPAFAAADSNTSFANINSSGSYIKVGNSVTCFGFLNITGSSATITTGANSQYSALQISGLPYSSKNSSNIFGGATFYKIEGFDDTEYAGNTFIGEILNNQNRVTAITYNSNGANTYLNIGTLFSGTNPYRVRNGANGTKPLKIQFMLKYLT